MNFIKRINRYSVAGYLFLCWIWGISFSDYIEGVDTTNINGYGLDSAFHVTSYAGILGIFLAQYKFSEGQVLGYFNYSFEEIKIAPDIIKLSGVISSNQIYYCFVLKNNKDSTYCKIQIIQKLSDGRYVFKYGKNTMPNDRIFEKPDYDSAILYKPNNLYNIPTPYHYNGSTDTTFWDPPLPNNNHLLGYIFYRSKNGVSIDTTAPINPAQWDSIAYCTSTKFINPTLCTGSGYFNIVAVYTEGKSEFLNGWTKSQYSVVKIKDIFSFSNENNKTIQIQKSFKGLTFLMPSFGLEKSATSFSFFDLTGRQLARFSDLKGNRVAWTAPEGVFKTGVYIAKAQLSDKSIVSRTFMITR